VEERTRRAISFPVFGVPTALNDDEIVERAERFQQDEKSTKPHDKPEGASSFLLSTKRRRRQVRATASLTHHLSE
jgi:hypothetical protein